MRTILDLAHRGPAILLLTNTTKDGASLRGRGEWSDRVDILYEVRDATGFTPSGSKPWWMEKQNKAGEEYRKVLDDIVQTVKKARALYEQENQQKAAVQ